MREAGTGRRLVIGAAMAVAQLAAMASPAGAAVSIGQLPTGSPSTFCVSPVMQDYLQPTVTSGSTYVVPANGTITSWSHSANTSASQMLTFKVFRQVAGLTYMAVGHDGPRPLTSGTVNTFSGLSIPVRAGDVIGLHKPAPAPACIFGVPGDSYIARNGNLSDGQQGDFAPSSDSRVNIAATVNPDNGFGLIGTQRNRKKGTLTESFSLPNPGELTALGNGARVAGAGARTSKTVGSGTAQLLIKAKGKKRRKLNETGKVKLTLTVTYTPTGGNPGTQKLKVKLLKR